MRSISNQETSYTGGAGKSERIGSRMSVSMLVNRPMHISSKKMSIKEVIPPATKSNVLE